MQNETESWKLPSVDGSQCVLANLPGAVCRTHSAHPGLHCELLRGSRQLRRMVTRIVLFVALLSVMVTSNNYCDIRQFNGYSVFFTSCKKIEGEGPDFDNLMLTVVKDYSRGKLHHIEWPQYLQDDMVDCIQGQTTLICDEWYNMSGTNKISSRCFPPASPSYWLDDEDKRDLAKCSTRDASGSPLDLLLDGDKIIVDTFEKGSIYLLQEEYLANKPTYYYHSNDGHSDDCIIATLNDMNAHHMPFISVMNTSFKIEHYRTLVGGASAETSTTTRTLEKSTTPSSPPSTNQTTTEESTPADVTSAAEEPATASNEPIPTVVANSTSLPLSTTNVAEPENSTTTSPVHAEITFNVSMTEEAAATSKEPAPVTMANATSSSVLETQMTTVIQREEFTTTLAAPAEVTSNVTATEELSTITIEGEPAPFVKKNSTAAALSTPEITSEAEPKSSTTTSVAPEKITSDNNTTEQPVTSTKEPETPPTTETKQDQAPTSISPSSTLETDTTSSSFPSTTSTAASTTPQDSTTIASVVADVTTIEEPATTRKEPAPAPAPVIVANATSSPGPDDEPDSTTVTSSSTESPSTTETKHDKSKTSATPSTTLQTDATSSSSMTSTPATTLSTNASTTEQPVTTTNEPETPSATQAKQDEATTSSTIEANSMSPAVSTTFQPESTETATEMDQKQPHNPESDAMSTTAEESQGSHALIYGSILGVSIAGAVISLVLLILAYFGVICGHPKPSDIDRVSEKAMMKNYV